MALVELNIGGRNYKIACEKGEEEHLFKLSKYVDNKAAELSSAMGHISEPLLLLMTALQIADELSESYDKLQALKAGNINDAPVKTQDIPAIPPEFDKNIAEKINLLAEKIYLVAQRLEKP